MTVPRARVLEERLTLRQVAERLNVSYTTVWRLIRKGKLKGVEKMGYKIVRVRASAVEEYLSGCRVS